ncbi:uroporphyrinogen-III C-methyltransferase [Herbiconiux sp. VKM Ac-2851]|uniref:uroporphyrinogen-III C-methyltransferase n=1 Tax=Herbiconiux sp. VKM Ac-2851 TaxID=2739025 RepID=UPI001563A124|nr:uroporphyrinogen-III C-methyltransferase [Herbiconiux sp. VKM Ac-2851]NQX33316.1 uroporphyrinogen-III C-methyltransferase [Herbiconiux sp. VKM Ac-2851]
MTEVRASGTREPANGGHVAIVGGGPGDEELLTVAALRELERADVVLYDRLAPHENLDRLAPHAQLIDVGKRPHHHPVSQREIEQLMVEHALEGKRVVRLKGGDPFVFGRGGEELLACRAAGIPTRVVPGVSSALAVPASAGIPLTHRGISHAFTVISGHAPFTESEFEHLAGLGGTIVVLMGITNLPSITAGLRRHGMRADMPVAAIERGFSPSSRTTVSSLAGILHDSHRVGIASPAVLVIGEVVSVAQAGDEAAVARIDSLVALAGS